MVPGISNINAISNTYTNSQGKVKVPLTATRSTKGEEESSLPVEDLYLIVDSIKHVYLAIAS